MLPQHIPTKDDRRKADSRDKREVLTRLKLLIQMRELVRDILDLQESVSDAQVQRLGKVPWADLQAELLQKYNTFVAAFGPINRFKMRKSGQYDEDGEQSLVRERPNLKKFRKDPDSALVSAIEIFDETTGAARPGPVFFERVLKARGESIHVQTIEEALGVCLSERGKVDFLYIAQVLVQPGAEEKIRQSLEEKGLVFFDPERGGWDIREAYLSGHIPEKIAQAKAYTGRDLGANVKALQSVLPRPLTPEEIDISLGMHWIPIDVIEAFVSQECDNDDIQIYFYPRTHSWFVEGTNIRDLQHALSNTRPSKPPVDGIDHVALLRTSFEKWVKEDPERMERLCKIYNERFNAIVPRQYDGSHMQIPGSSIVIDPKSHQRNAVWRNAQGGNMLNGHPVGAGKTFTAIWSAMTMKREGKIQKPLFVVPDPMLYQFSRDFMRLYPNGHILVLEKDQFEEDGPKLTVEQKIQKFIRRSHTENWDGIFITQSSFDRLSVLPVTRLQKALDELHLVVEAQRPFVDRPSIPKKMKTHLEKEMQKARVKVLEALGLGDQAKADPAKFWDAGGFEALKSLPAKDKAWAAHLQNTPGFGQPGFEDTGIDYLFIDEGHGYKNLTIESRIEGMAKEASARSVNLSEKLYHMRQKNTQQPCLTMMTATYISNTVSEVYTYQRYIQPELLKQYGLESFDAWAAMFGDVVETIEVTPEGSSYRPMRRLARYKNLPELLRMTGQFIDSPAEESIEQGRPRLKGGKPEIVVLPRSQQLAEFFQTLALRADKIRQGGVKPEDDNMLKIVMEGCLATLHPALVGIQPQPGEKTKIDYIAEEVARRYADQRGLIYQNAEGLAEQITGSSQAIFSDLGVPKAAGEFSVYNAIRQSLVKLGVPAAANPFVHDVPIHRKEELLAKVRSGETPIISGSTGMLGTGSNIQKRLAAVHHADVPWRPMDYIQRNGRIDRQGNQSPEVEIIYYVMQGSLDEYRLQTLERKDRFIKQFTKGDLNGARTFDEGDDVDNFYRVMKEISASPDSAKPGPAHQELAPSP